MSVIVKDMRMPKTCMDCPLSDGEYGWCDVDNSIGTCNDEKPKDCPLIDVDVFVGFKELRFEWHGKKYVMKVEEYQEGET